MDQRKAQSIGGRAGIFWDVLFCGGDFFAFLIAGIFINEAAAAEQLYTRIEAVLEAETAAFIQDTVAAISAANEGGS